MKANGILTTLAAFGTAALSLTSCKSEKENITPQDLASQGITVQAADVTTVQRLGKVAGIGDVVTIGADGDAMGRYDSEQLVAEMYYGGGTPQPGTVRFSLMGVVVPTEDQADVTLNADLRDGFDLCNGGEILTVKNLGLDFLHGGWPADNGKIISHITTSQQDSIGLLSPGSQDVAGAHSKVHIKKLNSEQITQVLAVHKLATMALDKSYWSSERKEKQAVDFNQLKITR